MNRPDVVEEIKKVKRNNFPAAQTILYGSEARGDARPDSDIDLLILLPGERVTPEQEYYIVSKLFDVELRTGVIISSLIMTRTRWEHSPHRTSFYRNVKKEGIEL